MLPFHISQKYYLRRIENLLYLAKAFSRVRVSRFRFNLNGPLERSIRMNFENLCWSLPMRHVDEKSGDYKFALRRFSGKAHYAQTRLFALLVTSVGLWTCRFVDKHCLLLRHWLSRWVVNSCLGYVLLAFHCWIALKHDFLLCMIFLTLVIVVLP